MTVAWISVPGLTALSGVGRRSYRPGSAAAHQHDLVPELGRIDLGLPTLLHHGPGIDDGGQRISPVCPGATVVVDDQPAGAVKGHPAEVERPAGREFGHGQRQPGHDEVAVAEEQRKSAKDAVAVRVEAYIAHFTGRLKKHIQTERG